MSENNLRLLQVVLDHNGYYTSTDLQYLKNVMDEILDEMRAAVDPRAHEWNQPALKYQLATALFRHFAEGKRDFDDLKRGALEAIPPVSPYWPPDTRQSATLGGYGGVGPSMHIVIPAPAFAKPSLDRREIRLYSVPKGKRTEPHKPKRGAGPASGPSRP